MTGNEFIQPLAQLAQTQYPGGGLIVAEAHALGKADGTLGDFWQIILTNVGPVLFKILEAYIASKKPAGIAGPSGPTGPTS